MIIISVIGANMDIQVLTYNIHKGVGWHTRKPTIEPIRQLLRQRDPDVIFLQEIRGTQFEFLAEELWPHFSYGKNAVYASGHHGNAILSKYPIHHSQNIDLSMGRYERRGLLHSIVQLKPEQSPLHLLCVHLGLFKTDRQKQLQKIVDHISAVIPKQHALILGGDFNDWGCAATAILVHELGLQEAFMLSHGNYARTFPAWKPLLKLDRIYYRGFQSAQAHRLMDKAWRVLSDHIPLEVSLILK